MYELAQCTATTANERYKELGVDAHQLDLIDENWEVEL
jgi:hypothetical protein